MESRTELDVVKPVIKRVIVMGDSISDRGTLVKKDILGFIPMRLILAFTAHTNHGRFTNAYTWDDDFASMIATGFLAEHIKRTHKNIDDTDIADAIINGDKKLLAKINNTFNLDNSVSINYNGRSMVKTYCEGGLTSANYRDEIAPNIALEASRHMLAILADKRQLLLEDDIKQHITRDEKAETLIIEWSGGNDLITVNLQPTFAEADKAVAARLQNIRTLIANQYQHFILFFLPDLSLTPRFYNRSTEERDNAKRVVEYFNTKLSEECRQIMQEFPHVNVDVFDVNTTLDQVIAHPAQFEFDPDKIHTPFITSKTYHDYKGGVLSAPGYIFWDDIHPTGHTHAIIASTFYNQFNQKYHFEAPDPATCQSKPNAVLMYEKFMDAYHRQLAQDKQKIFGFFRHGKLDNALTKLPDLILTDDEQQDLHAYHDRINKIFAHALDEGGKRTRGLLKKLGWIDKHNQVHANYLHLYKPRVAKRKQKIA